MILKIKDLTKILNVSEKTIYHWISENKVPTKKINNQHRFNKEEITDWLLQQRKSPVQKTGWLALSSPAISLSQLIQFKNLVYDIEGNDLPAIIKNAAKTISRRSETQKQASTFTLASNSYKMPIIKESGIAIQHPRNPIITDIHNEQLYIAFCKPELSNESSVHTVLFLACANYQRHLSILCKLSALCEHREFVEMLKNSGSYIDIIHYIKNKESDWEKIGEK
ncbi:MAG: hypothetical protein DKM50_13455 [Candidatus Margulisiibacteriota bacterium]|nr:MAG: hypothetical protein A2X42_09790 [Candidatus Margulisbacteria bacterium GWF2_38_17]PZM77285.1 MAG: hypothetical protein DKM50_13455 [Candidatus Margulisiibacteriota bacterium]HCY35904.1 hypothetical protein [Candidatus Margulisiibacteriota bacterium]